jgi:CDP-diacylglycerol--glycerol-3-phosphate 3-phosphatidyltransferase
LNCPGLIAGGYVQALDTRRAAVHTGVMRTADKITLSRILLAPVIFILYFLPSFFPSFSRASIVLVIAVTVAAECTDFLDGLYARKRNAVSDFGKIFDPFADVMLHLTLFLCCALGGYMPPLLLLLILYREFSMLFFRLLAVQSGTAIGARKGGKAKTALYVAAVFCAFAAEAAKRHALALPFENTRVAFTVIFSLCALAAYISFIDYFIHFRACIKRESA